MSLKCELMPDYHEATEAALNLVPLDGSGVFVLYRKTAAYTPFYVKGSLKMRNGVVYVRYTTSTVSNLAETESLCKKELNL